MPLDLTGFVKPLMALLHVFQRERHYKVQLKQQEEARRKEALKAVLDALAATRIYVAGLPDKYDRDREYELSELWAIAAIRCRRTLESVQDESLDKMRYWLDSIKWPQSVVKEKGIDLESMEAKFRALVEEK